MMVRDALIPPKGALLSRVKRNLPLRHVRCRCELTVAAESPGRWPGSLPFIASRRSRSLRPLRKRGDVADPDVLVAIRERDVVRVAQVADLEVVVTFGADHPIGQDRLGRR